jgi:hypothetical protein
VHWQHTHFVIKEKRKKKINDQKKLQQAIESREKAKSKITWRRQVWDPFGKGNGSTHLRQNYAQAKSTNHQSVQELPLHICILPLNKCQLWTQTGQAGSQNRSDRFHKNQLGRLPKSVRPHPPKAQSAKEMHMLPLSLEIGSRYAIQHFSTFLSSPCCQCMNQCSNLKICNLELLKFPKFIKRCSKWTS